MINQKELVQLSQELVQKIREYYKPEFRIGTLWFNVNGKLQPLPPEVHLTFGKPKEEAITFTLHGLIALLFPEEWEKMKDMYEDEKTENYVASEKKRLGLVEVKYGQEGVDFESSRVVHSDELGFVAMHWTSAYIGKLKNGQWAFEYSEAYIDDYQIISYIFDHEPTMKEINEALDLEDISSALSKNYREGKFKRDSGEVEHWTDMPGATANEKWLRFQSAKVLTYPWNMVEDR